MHKSVQTGESVITEADLTSEEPSADYWKRLAEKRQESLNESLQENDRLKEHVEALKEENRICKDMLEESRHLVQVLQVSKQSVFVSHTILMKQMFRKCLRKKEYQQRLQRKRNLEVEFCAKVPSLNKFNLSSLCKFIPKVKVDCITDFLIYSLTMYRMLFYLF